MEAGSHACRVCRRAKSCERSQPHGRVACTIHHVLRTDRPFRRRGVAGKDLVVFQPGREPAPHYAPWLQFTNRTPEPIHIELDSTLDYTIRWAGIPIKWRTRIIDWTPPTQFIDLQIRGPYTLWHHQHTFKTTGEGIECTDRVIYKLPGPGVSRLVHALTVKRQLMDIFRYRRKVIGEDLGWVRAVQPDVMVRSIG